MTKRFRRERSICSCSSPRVSFHSTPRSSFKWCEEDIWTEIANYLDAKSLVKLAMTCRWFHGVIMQESIWRSVCLRDLQVMDPGRVGFDWIKLYASLCDGSHSYMFRDKEKHIDWMRIGAFSFDSQNALLTEKPMLPLKIKSQPTTAKKMLETSGICVLNNIKKGIWIADLQLVRCPVCELDTCDGTMQTLDARHIELFLSDGYKNGSWKYELIGSYKTEKTKNAASGAIFDVKHLKDRATAGIFDLKFWTGKPDDFQPKAMITFNSVAINTNLQENQGLLTKFHAMRAGPDGDIVSIRISQQLL